VLKAYSESRNHCYLHPHRLADVKCERCKVGLCTECTHEYQGQRLCEHCAEELALIEASKPTRADRIRAFFRSLRNLVITIAAVVAVCAAVFFVFRGFFNQPITPEEMARFRYAAAGTFQTPDGINANSTVLGATVVSYTSQRPGFEASHLINEYAGPDYPGWRSANATFPQAVVVAHQQTAAISKVVLTQQPDEPKDTWVKTFAVDVSTSSPTSGWHQVGEWTLQPVTGPQRFTFPVAPSKWIRLRVLSNYGSPDYTSLGEFDAYVVNTNPSAPPVPSIPGQSG
jgi:hypothetical protein